MISVVIPTLNAEATLPGCLAALVPGAVDGVVREVIIVDGGSSDATALIADDAGARWQSCERGRGQQIASGVALARSPWLLILHADTVLEAGWAGEVSSFIEKVDSGRRASSAAVFRYALDDDGARPRLLEALVNARSRVLALPYGDQGLLISRRLYDEIGGFKPVPIMEDVDIVRRLGRRRLTLLRSRAITSAARYRKDGYLKRIARNQSCLVMYLAGVPVERIARFYGGAASLGDGPGLAKPDEAASAASDIKPS
jgi:rSAM/selenodomain-associated transferase 2